MDRKWEESRVGELVVRVAVVEANDCYADFEVLDWQYNRPNGPPVLSRIAGGFVRFDGCANADLARADGVMHHWCSLKDVEAFGRALVEARKVAARLIPGWSD